MALNALESAQNGEQGRTDPPELLFNTQQDSVYFREKTYLQHRKAIRKFIQEDMAAQQALLKEEEEANHEIIYFHCSENT